MLQHSVDVSHYVGVHDPHNPKALPAKPGGSTPVVIDLRGMRIAIDFHN